VGKKRIGFNTLSNVALLEPCTARQFVRHAVVDLTKRTFCDLQDESLEQATERWQVVNALDSLHAAYAACVGEENARVARRIEKFRQQNKI
jgi:hypothetical protein